MICQIYLICPLYTMSCSPIYPVTPDQCPLCGISGPRRRVLGVILGLQCYSIRKVCCSRHTYKKAFFSSPPRLCPFSSSLLLFGHADTSTSTSRKTSKQARKYKKISSTEEEKTLCRPQTPPPIPAATLPPPPPQSSRPLLRLPPSLPLLLRVCLFTCQHLLLCYRPS